MSLQDLAHELKGVSPGGEDKDGAMAVCAVYVYVAEPPLECLCWCTAMHKSQDTN